MKNLRVPTAATLALIAILTTWTPGTATAQSGAAAGETRPVAMVLKDQYPTSTDRAVVVTLDEKNTTPWTTNRTDPGVVTREAALAPGEVRTHTFTYTVRYPREMDLNL